MDNTLNPTYKSYQVSPFFFSNQIQLSNDATTPNTLLDVGQGVILDSTGTFQLTSPGGIVVNSAVVGLNGLDTGAIAASSVYAVYLVSDPVTLQATGAMISLSLTGPLMPFGYSAFALIGYVTTDGSKNFLKGYWTVGNGSSHIFMYDAPQATNITAGAATSYATTPVNLIHLVPNVNNTPVWIASNFLPNAASDTFNMQPANATGDAILVIGQVAAVHVATNSLILSQTLSISSVLSPALRYKVSTASASVAINVAGYEYYI